MRQETINNLVKASNALTSGDMLLLDFEATKKSLDNNISKLLKN